MTELVIPEPIECVWTGDWRDQNVEQPVGACGYWYDGLEVNPAISGVRRPIWVICPAWILDEQLRGTSFCIDHYSSVKHQLWDVTIDMDSLVVGEKPHITVNPSIHLVGIWHGWLQDGVLHQ